MDKLNWDDCSIGCHQRYHIQMNRAKILTSVGRKW